MAQFREGDAVAVPALVQEGHFPGEHMVTVDARMGKVSGLAWSRDMAGSGSVRGVVVGSGGETVSVKLAGSYFTTNGLVEFATGWASGNLTAIA